MAGPLELAGVPRELGFAQGRAAASALRAACAGRGALGRALDLAGRLDAGGARWHLDLRRHFPHQSEWLEGTSRGAALPLPALVRAARKALAAAPRALVAWEQRGAAQLACALPPGAALRRVAPEGRFRSLEWAQPELPSPWLGVNEAGLAVAAGPAAPAGAGCSAHAALFARDCLERFESVASALAWCLGRPAAPGALLFADASGEIAGVELLRDGRRVRRPEGGALALGPDPAACAALAKALAAAPDDARALAAAQGAPGGCAQADPRLRRLARQLPGAAPETASLQLSPAPEGA
jgi:hypothetical protein